MLFSNMVRLLATAAACALWSVAQTALRATATVASAETATRQFADFNGAGVSAQADMATLAHLQLPAIVLALVLAAIWRRPIKQVATMVLRRDRPKITSVIAVGTLLGVGALSMPAQAFYATTDVTEVIYILPNWSAFFIPDTGANKESQAAFGSVEYLNANKIAAKRFIIPHAKLSGTGGTSVLSGSDYYVPTGRMIITDRTPFFREWSDAADRGTSKRKEGFTFETKDSVDVGTGITISAYVSEQNAATFLYWFGTRAPDGDVNRPEVQFVSVLRSMTLADVMDGIVRAKVQDALATEFASRTFDQAIGQKQEIIAAVRAAVKAEFEPKGITIGFLGYAGPLDFAPSIQAAIDETVIATRQKAVASTVADSLPVLRQKALIDAINTVAGHWDGKLPALPSLVVLPDSVTSLMGDVVRSRAAIAASAPGGVPAR